MSTTQLPIVDSSLLNIEKVKPGEFTQFRKNGSLIPLAKELVNCLKEFGFCYLKHPGISESKVDVLLGSLRDVFLLPEERKKAYARRDDSLVHGYVTCEIENPDQVTNVGCYEAFMTCPAKAFCWPDEVPELKPASLELYRDFQELSYRALDLLGIGLQLEEPSFFRRSHGDDLSELRQTIYHEYPDGFEPNQGHLRFFEHCDLGTVALIYQDNAGGLQVKSKSGDWLDAEVIPDTVILMVGQMLQRWTSDKFRAPLHRVVVPTDRISRRQDRSSMTFFALTPDEFLFESVDGSNKYPPTTIAEWCFKRLKERKCEEI